MRLRGAPVVPRDAPEQPWTAGCRPGAPGSYSGVGLEKQAELRILDVMRGAHMHSPERPCGNRGPRWTTGVPVAHPGPPGAALVRLKHTFVLGLKMAAKS